MANRSTRYDDKQQATFCELAQTIGVGRAVRELGYPSMPVAYGWLAARGIEPHHDSIMDNARKFHRFYKTEDMLVAVDNALAVVEEMYSKVQTPDDAKKLAEAVQKLVNTRRLLEEKSTTISEKRETTQLDLEIAEALRNEEAKQQLNVELKQDV